MVISFDALPACDSLVRMSPLLCQHGLSLRRRVHCHVESIPVQNGTVCRAGKSIIQMLQQMDEMITGGLPFSSFTLFCVYLIVKKGVADELQLSTTERPSRNSKRRQSSCDSTYSVDDKPIHFIALNFIIGDVEQQGRVQQLTGRIGRAIGTT